MTESTETPARTHLKPVTADTSAPASEPAPPARPGGGHMTGLLALLLAVAVFGFLAQLSQTRRLQDENRTLRTALAENVSELEAVQQKMGEARSALGGLRNVLSRIDALLAPPVADGATEPAAPTPAAE